MTDETEIAEIRRRAADRARQLNLPYAGALTPVESFALMQAGAKLVDVRTRPELLYVGAVPGSLPLEWQTYPGNALNPDFLPQLAQAVAPGDTLMFLCRSGVRSHWAAAAAARAGWPDSYNVLEGFEGDRDPAQHRGTLGGWRKAGLPWVQG
ncbi:MAG: rhodanese-like domain-containing protein [Betaproteobacteria bacterium]|nr:rhodanese-like domain-containing protein [Betaproteobacteria bacterium]MDH4326043.1 rhodanese-like domain-containing protein [Betaproteobacteria bacterium]MDH5578838.1 rhodanese-like domain-containing protein [Betaproteobacteria bacterium]